MNKLIKYIKHKIIRILNILRSKDDTEKILIGKKLININNNKIPKNIEDIEFKIFSQFGDDGIIQFLINKIELDYKYHNFIEFGVENYKEANTKFLLLNNNWSGLIIDSSLRTPVTARVLAQESLASRRVFVACAESADTERQKVLKALGVGVVSLPDDSNSKAVSLLSVLRFLAVQEMNHVFVEAGPTLAGQFIDQALIDQLKVFVAPKLMGSEAQPLFKLPLAAMSSAIGLTIDDVSAVGDDWLFSCSLSSS